MESWSDEAARPPEQQRRAPPVRVTDPVTGDEVEMSKTAAKKLAKRALRQEKKDATKHERRAKERQRRKERRHELKAQRAQNPEAYVPRVRTPAVPFGARVVVDLGFDDLMTADEATSLAAQLGYLYGANRSSANPFQEVVFAGAGRVSGASLGFAPPHGGAHVFPTAGSGESSLFRDRVGVHMEEKNQGSWRRWQRVKLLEYGGLERLWEARDAADEAWANVAPSSKDDIVYLTADTDDTIDALEEGKTYIIGGIVDRNRYKNLCAKKAEALGIRTARLPIDPAFLAGQRMNARKVLTVNQVFEILVGWTETRDWTAALQRGLPTRKFHQNEGGEADAADAAAETTDAPSQ